MIEAATDLASLLRADGGCTARDLTALHRLGQRLTIAPELDKVSLADPVWTHHRQEIADLVTNGVAMAASRAWLDGIVADVAWTAEMASARQNLAAFGPSFLRWFKRPYREAQAALRGILRGPVPKPLADRLSILDHLLFVQNARWELDVREDKSELGRRAFGSRWRGSESDWRSLQSIDQWDSDSTKAGVAANFRDVLANLEEKEPVAELVELIANMEEPLLDQVRDVFGSVELDLRTAFGTDDLEVIPLTHLKRRLIQWDERAESITQWIAFRIRWSLLPAAGLGGLADQLLDGRITPEVAVDRLMIAFYECLAREVFRRHLSLSQFNGEYHEQRLAEFRRLDLERIQMARAEVARSHYSRRNRADVDQLRIVLGEVSKKRGHRPLRKLFERAPNAVQAIKPVFMMSPISVAQFLEPGAIEFDLLLIDEASQVQPVDALGAIARARQLVVVGDDKQLPPTRFFNQILVDGGDDDDQDSLAANLESILGLCVTQNVPQRMLRWHYRSRHQSLIAVSIKEFYPGLFVVPSPTEGSDEGLHFHHVENGVFDRGGSATNRVEAKAVAQAVIEHVRKCPERSLGVGAFSVAQRDAILDELELLRRQDIETEEFFAAGGSSPFFVKNLENIQGDERDVIFISVGYARDASGYMAMNFGPLSNTGGERRLNVLISRARERCDVFSSITADDIDLDRAKGRGAEVLKEFLNYAANRILGVPENSEGDHDSEFERQVARAIRGLGFKVHAQVGTAGFFVDLAVVDPDLPGRYLLGIECDGAAYHSSRSARDRDRLRQQVLEDHRWIIHRIWSTDWFYRPEEQLRKVMAAIEKAKAAWAYRGPAARVSSGPPAIEVWRMTRGEFHKYKRSNLPDHEIDLAAINREFKAAIMKAIDEGKDVPPETRGEIGLP